LKTKVTDFDTRFSQKNQAKNWVGYHEHLVDVIERLREVTIEEEDGIDLIERHSRSHGPETLVYCDPPYIGATRRTTRQYRYDMTDEERIRFLNAARKSNIMFIISGYYTDLYSALLPDWSMVTKHNINGASKHVTECLWLSPEVGARCLTRLLKEARPCVTC
jgi:DNA adenine methylase